jgi:phosphopantothenoylcysteine decarboxylase/phosphopantothenate--cysteine ligase
MGYSFAKASFILGADEVLLISAPTCLEKPYGVKKIDVISAEDMYNAVIENFKNYDVIIMNAAVADFKPAEYSNKKLKKTKEKAVVKLKQNPDILKELGSKKRKEQILIGFAAESENLEENAKEKLKRKNLDVIIVNELNVFSKEHHEGKIIFKNNEIINIPPMTKEESAIFILEKIFNKLM